MHTQSKFYSILTKGVLFFLMFSMVSCLYYRKRKMQPVPPDSWRSLIEENGKEHRVSTFVRIISGDKHYEMLNLSYEGGILKGNLKEVDAFEIPKNNGFRVKKIPKEQRADFRKTLYVFTDKDLEEGIAELDINDFGQFLKFKDDVISTLVTSVGTVVLVGAGAVALVCFNCPKAYVVDEAGEKHFQGAMFTGAITKSRERIDLLPIETFVTEADKLSVHIANEFAEVEHINQLELLKVKRQKDYEVGFGLQADLFEYKSLLSPVKATSVDGRDFLEILSANDGSSYDFDDERQAEELNTIRVRFQRSAFTKDQVKLLL